MEPKLLKISVVANFLGVSVKTIYNWINHNKLEMPEPGYVYYDRAYEVSLEQQANKSAISYFMAVKGIKRDSNGRFQQGVGKVEESGA